MRALAIVALLMGSAHGDPVTWISNDEAFADSHTWWSWGAGLAIRRTLPGDVELGLEGQALRVDASSDDDPRHGFALRGAVTIDVPIERAHWGEIDWRLSPQLGAGGQLLYGLGRRDATEVFAGVRFSFRKVVSTQPAEGIGVARAIGGHVTFRIARSDAELSGSVMIGYDWGM